MAKIYKFVTAVFICEAVGILSTPFTIAAIPTWYKLLNKPVFAPPNWVFAPVWTILYFMMGLSASLIWAKGLTNKKVKNALAYFIVNLILNFLWSLIFFGLHSPFFALIDILFLLVVIGMTIGKFHRISKPASYLLVPYISWVAFAAILNLAIVLLN